MSFLQYLKEDIMGGFGSVVGYTVEAALVAGLEFSPDVSPGPGKRSPWTTGVNDLFARMSGASDPEGFSAIELETVLESLLEAGGMHADQRKVALEGIRKGGKPGLLKMVQELSKKSQGARE